MQILITGAAGFIGFNLSKYLLSKSNVKIIGIDSLNNYYSTKLKKDRIKELLQYKKFSFFLIVSNNLSPKCFLFIPGNLFIYFSLNSSI